MARWVSSARTATGCALLVALAASGPAAAFEFFDGKIQVHGYFEEQLRTIAADLDPGDGYDVSQWQQILGIETDLNVAPDGWGPFDLVSGFVRLEVRFDCIWYQCGGIQGINAWGNDAEKFPSRNTGARGSGYVGTLVTGDTRRYHAIPIDELGFAYKDKRVRGNNTPAYIWHVPGVSTLFGVRDPLQTPELEDDPAFYVFGRYIKPGDEYRFALRKFPGQPNGNSYQVLGPFFPENEIVSLAALADIANPFSPLDENPVLLPAVAAGSASSAFGSAALPYRPAPQVAASRRGPNGRSDTPRGLFIPNEGVAKLLRNHEFDDFDQNFRQNELAWNKGASQSDERELKEAYVDLEMLDSRLWLRLGKQNIVWGKTELFRTTDQFNPQDLALATLASLEESRIALWAARGVYSFYTVGPFEDMRLEVALNFDQMEPTDLGRCGEPYTPNPVCDKTAGLFAHGLAGTALAGEIRPPDPWDDTEGLEYGARLEFRWNRFSFAISEFYGYDDFPYVDPVFLYEHNVDPRTGYARRGMSREDCDRDNLYGGDTSGCLDPDDALFHHHANQQRFAVICAASIGFSDLDRNACAQSVFNSNAQIAGSRVAPILGSVFSGSLTGRQTVTAVFFPDLVPPALPPGAGYPIVRLNRDSNDGPPSGAFGTASLSYVLTDEQEALVGCGRFWQTDCDAADPDVFGGIDLLNSELSVLIQSWPGFPGTAGEWLANAGPSGPIQPGTIRDCAASPSAPGCEDETGYVPFRGGTVARRYEDGQRFTLPGARSPFVEAPELRFGDVAWDPTVDGCVRASDSPDCGSLDIRHPYSGDYFLTEMAAFSWNYMMVLISFSTNGDKPNVPCGPGQDISTCRTEDEFIATPTYYLREDGCSYARPEVCSNVAAIYSVAHTTRKSVRASGSGDYGRTDFDWHQGGVGVLRYEKRNVLGFSMDFAEDATKSNWGVESTWIQGNQYDDRNEIDGLRRADTYNLTVSVDRPTFINFMNKGRTFFFNSQWFFQWIQGYRESFSAEGPWNVLATFHVDTGYFSDRLLPGLTLVWDFQSRSGAILPEIAYRFTENLSATLTAGLFNGRFQAVKPPLRGVADFPYRAGKRDDVDWNEQGLSPIRDNDELAVRVRYTF